MGRNVVQLRIGEKEEGLTEQEDQGPVSDQVGNRESGIGNSVKMSWCLIPDSDSDSRHSLWFPVLVPGTCSLTILHHEPGHHLVQVGLRVSTGNRVRSVGVEHELEWNTR